jgi:hypothetical protein
LPLSFASLCNDIKALVIACLNSLPLYHYFIGTINPFRLPGGVHIRLVPVNTPSAAAAGGGGAEADDGADALGVEGGDTLSAADSATASLQVSTTASSSSSASPETKAKSRKRALDTAYFVIVPQRAALTDVACLDLSTVTQNVMRTMALSQLVGNCISGRVLPQPHDPTADLLLRQLNRPLYTIEECADLSNTNQQQAQALLQHPSLLSKYRRMIWFYLRVKV